MNPNYFQVISALIHLGLIWLLNRGKTMKIRKKVRKLLSQGKPILRMMDKIIKKLFQKIKS